MKGRKKRPAAAPDAPAAAPIYARNLEDQHGGDAGAKATAPFRSLKYPSDRDEDDVYSPARAEAAPTEAAPSRMTLKYPSDRDEIDWHVAPHDNAAGAR